MRAYLLILALIYAPISAAQINPQEPPRLEQIETSAHNVGRALRCVVCQNQSIDDSDADLAKDLRKVIRERITAGDNEAQIKDYLVTRYGEFILLKPRFNRQTALLWGSPLIMVLIGIFFAGFTLRRRPNMNIAPEETAATPLSQDDENYLNRLRED